MPRSSEVSRPVERTPAQGLGLPDGPSRMTRSSSRAHHPPPPQKSAWVLFQAFSLKSGRWGARSAFYWAGLPDLAIFSEQPPCASAPRRIVKSRREEPIRGKRCSKICVSHAPGVLPLPARGAAPGRSVSDGLRHFWCLRCTAPCVLSASTSKIARSLRDLDTLTRNLDLKPSSARTW